MNADFFSTKNLIRLSLRIATVLLGLFLLVEAVLWLFFRAPAAPELSLELKNSLPGLKKSVKFSMNRAEQLRTINWTAGPKAPGAVRILCVGGHATVGQLQNADDTWWGQLASALQEKLAGVKIEVGANTTSFTSLRGAKWASSFVDDWKPDIILVNLGAADVLGQPIEYSYSANRFDSMPSAKQERSFLKETALKFSQLAKRVRLSRAKTEDAYMANEMGRTDYFSDFYKKLRTDFAKITPIPNTFRMSDADPRNEYHDALQHFLAMAKSVNATLILTGEPNLCHQGMSEAAEAARCTFVPKSRDENLQYRTTSMWVQLELNRFQETAEKFAKDNDLVWVDLNGEVPQDVEHFVNETILTDLGAQKMAALLLPKVLPVVQKRTP